MNLQILDNVTDFLESLSEDDAAKIFAHLKSLEANQTEGLTIKPLKGKIKELVVRQYRIIFFRIGEKGYAVDAFKKQSQKTPRRIIGRAERIYQDVNKNK